MPRFLASPLAIDQTPGTNALATAGKLRATIEQLSQEFPPGLAYEIGYNPTDFVQASVDAVSVTIFEAIALVVLVVILFLQNFRTALIPILAIPVSLVGTFAVMAAFGFSLNNLTLFAWVFCQVGGSGSLIWVKESERSDATPGGTGLPATLKWLTPLFYWGTGANPCRPSVGKTSAKCMANVWQSRSRVPDVVWR